MRPRMRLGRRAPRGLAGASILLPILSELDSVAKGLKPMSTPTPFKVKGPFAKLTVKSSEVMVRGALRGWSKPKSLKVSID